MDFIYFLMGWTLFAIVIGIWAIWSDRKMEKEQK